MTNDELINDGNDSVGVGDVKLYCRACAHRNALERWVEGCAVKWTHALVRETVKYAPELSVEVEVGYGESQIILLLVMENDVVRAGNESVGQ